MEATSHFQHLTEMDIYGLFSVNQKVVESNTNPPPALIQANHHFSSFEISQCKLQSDLNHLETSYINQIPVEVDVNILGYTTQHAMPCNAKYSAEGQSCSFFFFSFLFSSFFKLSLLFFRGKPYNLRKTVLFIFYF